MVKTDSPQPCLAAVMLGSLESGDAVSFSLIKSLICSDQVPLGLEVGTLQVGPFLGQGGHPSGQAWVPPSSHLQSHSLSLRLIQGTGPSALGALLAIHKPASSFLLRGTGKIRPPMAVLVCQHSHSSDAFFLDE